MQQETIKKLFTVREYHRMGEVGILGPEDRTELIDGEVIRMSPTGHRHAMCVTRAIYAFTVALQGKASARVSELWIENLNADELLVFREPTGDAYKTSLTLRRGDSVSVAAFPEALFKIDDLLG